MAINESNVKQTVDFEYEDSTIGIIYIRFHNTTEYGETVSITRNKEEDNWASLPAKLFEETVDFLRQKGHVKSKSALPQIGKQNNFSNVIGKTLPITKINKAENTVNIPIGDSPFTPTIDKVHIEKQVESLVNPSVYSIPDTVLSSKVKISSKKIEELMSEEVSPEDLKKRALEKKNTVSQTKKIKSKHRKA